MRSFVWVLVQKPYCNYKMIFKTCNEGNEFPFVLENVVKACVFAWNSVWWAWGQCGISLWI